MKPVMQTRFSEDGNCFEACIASILEIPLEEVPDLKECKDVYEWNKTINSWLKTKGLQYMELETKEYPFYFIESYHLIIGHKERGIYHAVVGLNGNVVHNPHPNTEFIWGGKFTRTVS